MWNCPEGKWVLGGNLDFHPMRTEKTAGMPDSSHLQPLTHHTPTYTNHPAAKLGQVLRTGWHMVLRWPGPALIARAAGPAHLGSWQLIAHISSQIHLWRHHAGSLKSVMARVGIGEDYTNLESRWLDIYQQDVPVSQFNGTWIPALRPQSVAGFFWS